jgi:hypothetical protein
MFESNLNAERCRNNPVGDLRHHGLDIFQHFGVGSLQSIMEKSHIFQIDMPRTGRPSNRRSHCRLSAVDEHRHPVTE